MTRELDLVGVFESRSADGRRHGGAGEVVRSPRGLGTTNCAFGGPEGRTLYITESDSGSILKAEFPEELGIKGAPMFSGAH